MLNSKTKSTLESLKNSMFKSISDFYSWKASLSLEKSVKKLSINNSEIKIYDLKMFSQM